ncbi:MAG TPA: hypothetical protein VH253_07025 [Phycisphaerae bacterium]|nr:hypothetical protein [Phycisphaerae bacterium]
MTGPPAISAADAALPVTPMPESFWGTVFRRVRYVAGVGISGVLFWTLGWLVASPPADYAGVSLTVWPGHHALLELAGLAVILLVATGVSALICHPDSPHQGLWCGSLGLVALSVRGGKVFTIIRYAQVDSATYGATCRLLALECVHWTVLFLLAEAFARFLHDQVFANTRWITRHSQEVGAMMARAVGSGERESRGRRLASGKAGAMGVSEQVSGALGTGKLGGPLAGVLAVVANAALALVFLLVLLQSQSKGQVVVAMFASFFASTLCSYMAFPTVPAVVQFAAVPVAAAAGYLYAAGYPGLTGPQAYPGHPGIFFARALPIDYFAAGVPGAISGFYTAFHWSLQSHEGEGG